MDIEIGNVGNVNIDISSEDIELEAQTQTREVGEATSYEELNNLPQINDITLIGNVSLNELGIQSKGNYLTSETDPIFSASASASITSQDITVWNAKADSSAIPTKTSDLTNDGDGTSESKFATESYVNANGGKIDKIKVNGTQQTITNKSVDITVPTNNNQLINGAGYIIGIDSTDVTTALGFTPYNSTNPDGYQTSNEVESAINTKISSTYKAKGSVTFANLPALASSNEGNVYNVSDSFTTTSDFVEGAGKSYPAGTNVVIINTTGSTYKYDVLSGMVDLSGYQTKIDSSHKLSSDLVDDTNNTKKFVTSSEKSIWNGKQDTIIAGTNISIASDGKTISATDTTYNEATTSTAGLMSSSDKNKLNGIASGAEVNVQANWNESNSNSDAYIKNKPSIPPEVTETTVANWGFTKNTGDYSKPSGGIPATDLSSAVQTSLSKADSAIQNSDLTNYVTNSDYASSTTGGVLKVLGAFATGVGTAGDVRGGLYAATKTYDEYQNMSNLAFVGRGTLNNVLDGKGLVKTTSISSSSTDDNVVTPKAVYDYIQSLDANEVSY